jgi:hypothetical protein
MGAFSQTIEWLKAQQAQPPAPVAESTPSNLVDTNIIYSPKFGQLDFSNDPWQYASRSGSGTERGQTFAITFNFGGKNYSFIPEDRIQKGWVDSGRYTYSPAFLNEDTIKSLATNGEYIDLSKAPITGAQFADGSTIKTYGDYLSKTEVGASPKGFLVPAEQLGNYFPNTSQVDPKFGAIRGLARDPDTGELGYAATGGGNIQAPIVKASRVSYYEKPSGVLADFGRAIMDLPPVATFALDLVVPGLGTGISVGRAIGVGDIEGAAKALVIGEIVGQSGVAQNVAGATGSAALGTAAAGTAGGLLAGQNLEQAATTGAVQGAMSGAAGTIAENQAAKYIENLPIPDYLDAGPAPTSADTMAAFPETNPANFVGPPTSIDTTPLDLTTPSNFVGPPTAIDTTLLDLSNAAPSTQTYTYEDGSTLTVDKSGGVVGYTDATETPYKGPVETPSSPLTKSQIEGMIKLGLTVAGASEASKAIQNAISSGGGAQTSGFQFTPSDITGWGQPEYTQTFQGPIDINSLFTTDNLLGGTQWAGLQGNQFANIPQVSMSDFISSIQNGKV